MEHESKEKLHLLQALIDAIPMPIYFKDLQGIYQGCNKAFEKALDISRDNLIGKTVHDVLSKKWTRIFCQKDNELFSHPGAQVFDAKMRCADGLRHHLSFHRATYEDAAGCPAGLVGVYIDITDCKQVEERPRQNASELQAVFQAIPDLFLRVSADGTCREVLSNNLVNPYEPAGDWSGQETKDYSHIMGQQFLQAIADSLSMQSLVVIEYPVIIEGETRFLEARFIPMCEDEAIVVVRNITERKQTEDRLRYLSFHDLMTGVYNRSFFEEELKRLDARRQLPLSIIIGDIDGLKLVNDTLGHRKGDRLIGKVAGILKASCRAEDIVCRWGGDEFAILLPKTDRATAEGICDRIRKACEKARGEPIPVSVSLGVATKQDPDQKTKDVLREAEDMMYWKKLASNNTRFSTFAYVQRTLAEKTQKTLEYGRIIQDLALKMGNSLGLSRAEQDELAILAVLHDIGEIAIPENILMKPDRLTPEEWQIVKKHPEIGNNIAKSAPNLTAIAEAILTHHERWDGMGYPYGLQGERIPLHSRILAIADAYDAMISGRPYKEAVSHQEALMEIERCAGTQFEPELVALFLSILS